MAAPAFLIPIIPVLTAVIVSAAGRILSAIGLTVVSFYGITLLTDQLFNYISGSMSGLPGNVATFINMFQVIPALKLICSAYVAKFAISGFKKMIVGGGS